ncbi:MAG: hypothetical protein ACK41C_11290 [Phenylobacterium sp.]|uniref:hypothetical protein n=1 Tax=Phenylobacterium sp. TaxID=1871053 RepID=UPI00391DD310
MFNLLAVGFLIWISATFVSLWIHGARTGVAPLVGPLLGIRQDIHPIGYFVAMSALAIPMLLCLALLFWGLSIAFPREGIPLPPAQGYVEAGAVTNSGATNAYFPPALARITYQCADFAKPIPILSEPSANSYTRMLKAAGEPSLVAGLNRVGPHANIYRFTWSNSFDTSVVVRIEEGFDGRLHVAATRLSNTGEIDRQVKRLLTPEERQKFVRAFIGAKRLKVRGSAAVEFMMALSG